MPWSPTLHSATGLTALYHESNLGSPVAENPARRVLRGGTGTSVLDARLVPTHHSVPHAELIGSVARRVVDGAMLHLIQDVAGSTGRGNRRAREQTSEYAQSGRRSRYSTRTSPISPLFSNLYMRRFVLGWKKLGHEERWKAYIVNYADDLCHLLSSRSGAKLCTRCGNAMMSKLKLTVNEKKTRVCYLPEEKFDFLGYHVRAVLLDAEGPSST